LNKALADIDVLNLLEDVSFYPHSYELLSRKLRQISGKKPQSGNTILIRDKKEVVRKIKMARRRKSWELGFRGEA